MSTELKNKLQIFYNPYNQSVKFKYMNDSGKWQNVGKASGFLYDLSINKTVLLNHAWSTLKTINDSSYNTGNSGIEVTFFGTENDYNDLSSVYETKKEDGLSENFKLLPDKPYALPDAAEAMEIIEDCYNRIKLEFKPYLCGEEDPENTKTITNAIATYDDILKQRINISVLGNYSTGKSSFINALIGAELLPVGAKAKTALIYKVYDTSNEDKSYSIQFTYGTEKIEMLFIDGKYNYEPRESECDIKKKIDDVARNKHTTIEQMNAALSVINVECKNDYASVINVKYPFRHRVFNDNDFTLTITDVPGSDSEKNKDAHGNVLNEALASQTDTLPIFLMAPSREDATSNEELRDKINKASNGINVGNMIIAMNKADISSKEDLKFDSNIFDKWRKYKILYLSSVIALGAYKENDEMWIDEAAEEFYKDYKTKFTDTNHENYRQLYKYNIISNSSNAYVPDKNKNILFINSGFDALLHEIRIFAKKYALCGKAKAACDRLIEILGCLEADLNKKQDDLRRVQNEYQRDREKREKEIKEEIKNETLDIDDLIKDISDSMYKKYSKRLEDFYGDLKIEITEKWDHYKKDKTYKRGQEKVAACNKVIVDYVDGFYNETFNDAMNEMEKEVLASLEKIDTRIKEKIISNDDITTDTKKAINDINITRPVFDASYEKFKNEGFFNKRLGLFWQIIKPDDYHKRIKIEINSSFLESVFKTPIKQMLDEANDTFMRYKDDIINNIGTKSIELLEYEEKIKSMQNQIKKIGERLENLCETNNTLKNLLIFKCGELDDE